MDRKQIGELLEQTGRIRYEFLAAEIQTCITALEMAEFELSKHNLPVVEREMSSVDEGIRVVERFLNDFSLGDRAEIEKRLANLKTYAARVKTAVLSSK
ncbi:MAG TPA: hypothetical protein VG675_24090 [Bryobacteraceae bacterium]|nr:hypothetical protein [Bryobacteraceae bacterium]